MEFVIPFTLTAAQVNTLDTSPVSIVSSMKSNYVYIPKRLVLKKNSGTGYTLAAPALTEIPRTDRVEGFFNTADEFAFTDSLVVSETLRESGTKFSERPIFAVKVDTFLSSSAEKTLVALPISDQRVFQPGSTRYRIRLMSGVSGGTGSLEGWLYLDEFAIGR